MRLADEDNVVEVDRYDDYDGHLERHEIQIVSGTMVMQQDGRAVEGDTFYDEPDVEAVTEELATAVWDTLTVDVTSLGVTVVRETGES